MTRCNSVFYSKAEKNERDDMTLTDRAMGQTVVASIRVDAASRQTDGWIIALCDICNYKR